MVRPGSLGPALVGVIKKDWSSDNSIALSWTEEEHPPLDIIDYEVKYYEKVIRWTILHLYPCWTLYFVYIYIFFLSGFVSSVFLFRNKSS